VYCGDDVLSGFVLAHVRETLVLAGRLKVVLMVISQFTKAVCLLCTDGEHFM